MSELPESYKTEILDGKNAHTLKCKFCGSIILKPELGSFVKIEYNLPTIEQKSNSETPTSENVVDFWLIDDMYTFYNIGFSNTIANIKYLTCADCDTGPIGYHDLNTKKSYVALGRVKYV